MHNAFLYYAFLDSTLSYLERLFVTNLSLEIRCLRYDCVLLHNIFHDYLYSVINFLHVDWMLLTL